MGTQLNMYRNGNIYCLPCRLGDPLTNQKVNAVGTKVWHFQEVSFKGKGAPFLFPAAGMRMGSL